MNYITRFLLLIYKRNRGQSRFHMCTVAFVECLDLLQLLNTQTCY